MSPPSPSLIYRCGSHVSEGCLILSVSCQWQLSLADPGWAGASGVSLPRREWGGDRGSH